MFQPSDPPKSSFISFTREANSFWERLLWLRYQSWDVVIGAEGPLFLEVNSEGGIAQVPGGRGFNDPDFRRFRAGVK